jgi:small subunit ribosomal protein S3
MGQKVNPIGFRTGIVMGWKSRWYASKKEFAELLVEDQKIRKFIKFHPTKPAYREAGIDRIEIERTRDEVRLHVFVAKPGLLIGKKGTEIEILQEELQNLIGRRVSFRRTMKRSIEMTMDAGAKGIKIQLSGRLGGAEMARCEKANAGALPLSTIQAKISYGFAEASTPQGNIGVQVWVNQGSYAGDNNDGADAQAGQAPKKPKRTYKR